jgi:thiosulfate/3-mercaptopyruvate sulfurtransferase
LRQGEERRLPRAFRPDIRAAKVVTAEDVLDALRTLSAIVIDSRAPERYRGDEEPIDPVAGHIPGARNRPWQENVGPDGKMRPPEALRREFELLLGGRPPGQTIFYCGSGVTASHNLLAMDYAGLPGARLYAGSWSEWCSDVSRPVATGDEGPK